MTDFAGISYDLLAQRFQNAPEYDKIWNQFMDVRFLLNGFKQLPPLVERNCNEAAAAVMSAPAKLFLKMLEKLKDCCLSNSVVDSGNAGAVLRDPCTERKKPFTERRAEFKAFIWPTVMERARNYLRQCKMKPDKRVGYLGLSIQKLATIYTANHPEARSKDVLWFFQNGSQRRTKHSKKDENMLSLKSLIGEAIDTAKKEVDAAAAATLAASEACPGEPEPIELFTPEDSAAAVATAASVSAPPNQAAGDLRADDGAADAARAFSVDPAKDAEGSATPSAEAEAAAADVFIAAPLPAGSEETVTDFAGAAPREADADIPKGGTPTPAAILENSAEVAATEFVPADAAHALATAAAVSEVATAGAEATTREAEAAITEGGPSTPSGAAAAILESHVEVVAMESATADAAHALAAVVAVSEAVATACAEGADATITEGSTSTPWPAAAAAGILENHAEVAATEFALAAVTATPPTVRTLRSRDRKLPASPKKSNQQQPVAAQKGKNQRSGRRAGTAVQEMLMVKTASASALTPPSPGFHFSELHSVPVLGKRLLEELNKDENGTQPGKDLDSDDDDVPLAHRAKVSKAEPDNVVSSNIASIYKAMFEAMGITDSREIEQVGSILEYGQEQGLKFLQCDRDNTNKDASVWEISASLDTSMDKGTNVSLPGLEVTLVIEKRKRPPESVYNSLLFRRAFIISTDRKRKQHDRFLEKSVCISKNGGSFGYSLPDGDGKSYCFLVVERHAHSFTAWNARSVSHGQEKSQLDERTRCFIQSGLQGLRAINAASIVLGGFSDQTIWVHGNGSVVFRASGCSWRADSLGGGCTPLQRRATSLIMPSARDQGLAKMSAKVRTQILSKEELAIWKALQSKSMAARKNLPSTRGNGHTESQLKEKSGTAKATKHCKQPRLLRPTILSPKQIAGIMQGLADKRAGLASLEDGVALFMPIRSDNLASSEPLSFIKDSQKDVFGFLRAILMILNPVPEDAALRTRWDTEARAAEQNPNAMSAFILQGRGATLQRGVLDRIVDFLCKGFLCLDASKMQDHLYATSPVHPPQIYQAILGSGFRVSGGGMDTIDGCPFRNIVVQDVVVIQQGEMGAGLQSTTNYKAGDVITFYFAKIRRGTAISDDPVGRYILAVLPFYLYGNGEFSEFLTLTKFGEKRAMGVCINAGNTQKEMNCVFMRRSWKSDSNNGDYMWVPIVASRPISAGEYFGLKYDPEAAGGRSFGKP